MGGIEGRHRRMVFNKLICDSMGSFIIFVSGSKSFRKSIFLSIRELKINPPWCRCGVLFGSRWGRRHVDPQTAHPLCIAVLTLHPHHRHLIDENGANTFEFPLQSGQRCGCILPPGGNNFGGTLIRRCRVAFYGWRDDIAIPQTCLDRILLPVPGPP